jgi:phage terminase large subunit-like protein
VYEADKDCDLMDEAQWVKSNPALGVFRNENDLRTQLTRAARMSSAEPSARNLLLNQRISLQTLAVAPSIWKKNSNEVIDELFLQHPVHMGLDLSARNDLTACVLAVRDPETGQVHVKPIVFTPLDSLEERSRRDRTPYDQWVKMGKMIALPGSHMDYDMMAQALKMHTTGIEISTVQFDRWKINDFKPRAEAHAFADDADWISVGQGYKDFGLRVDGLDSLLFQGKINHGNHPLLTLGAANAIVVSDPTGAKKYDKSKSSQRIDTLVALAMAVYPLSDGNFEIADVDTMII